MTKSFSMGLILAASALQAQQPASAQTVSGNPSRPTVDIVGRSLTELTGELRANKLTSEQVVRAYLDRIGQIDRTGPRLNSIIAVSPDAVAQAQARDREQRVGRGRGPLHGMPILIKDNIEVAGSLPTTAGSLALAQNITNRDAPLVARLRTAGAVILGKTNLSEWANIRSDHSVSGWSAIGGLVRNPYALDRNACGSSSGSGAAVAAGLAAAAIGTETDGSITCPASMMGLVGFKPTVGLVSRRYIVPISSSQDTAGPMTRTVRDAATVLGVIAGTDPGDAATVQADTHRRNYAAALDLAALKGKRIGVLRFATRILPDVDDVFEAALSILRAAGAELVEIDAFPGRAQMKRGEEIVLLTEFKAGVNAYLASTPGTTHARTLAELIAFNKAHAGSELRLFDQDQFRLAEATQGITDPAYLQARETSLRLAGAEGIDRMLAEHRLSALVAPTTGPAFMIDLVTGDHSAGGGAGSLAAIAGYPHLTVPMGQVKGLPVGLSFIGSAWSDGQLLAFGYAFEQRRGLRLRPTFAPTSEHLDGLGEATQAHR